MCPVTCHHTPHRRANSLPEDHGLYYIVMKDKNHTVTRRLPNWRRMEMIVKNKKCGDGKQSMSIVVFVLLNCNALVTLCVKSLALMPCLPRTLCHSQQALRPTRRTLRPGRAGGKRCQDSKNGRAAHTGVHVFLSGTDVCNST